MTTVSSTSMKQLSPCFFAEKLMMTVLAAGLVGMAITEDHALRKKRAVTSSAERFCWLLFFHDPPVYRW